MLTQKCHTVAGTSRYKKNTTRWSSHFTHHFIFHRRDLYSLRTQLAVLNLLVKEVDKRASLIPAKKKKHFRKNKRNRKE